MAKRRRQKHNYLGKKIHQHSLQSLISAIQCAEDLNPANMKLLYIMLYSMTSDSLDVKLAKLKLEDVHSLSDLLFKELDLGFNDFFSVLHQVSVSPGCGQTIFVADILGKSERLLMLLRCCLQLLVLMKFKPELRTAKYRLLLSILGRLMSTELSAGGNDKDSLNFRKSVSLGCTYVNPNCKEVDSSISLLEDSEPFDSCHKFMCRALEVFADELLMHESLREYLMMFGSLASESVMLFNFHFVDGNIGSVLEVICSHFFLSVSGELAFVNFINRLVWCNQKYFRISEISLPAALSLLLSPVVLSAPKMFHAYVVSVISEAIGICADSENTTLDVQFVDWYLQAFERSVILYASHMSSFHVDGDNLTGNGSFISLHLLGNDHSTFESYLLQATIDKLHRLIAESKKFWDSYLSIVSFGTNTDMVSASVSYVKENLCIFDESFRDEVLSILNCIILGCSSNDVHENLFKQGETSPQDIYLLASILKLMSSSLLKVVFYLKCNCLKSLRDSKEYNYIVGILDCFQHFSSHLPIQNFLCEMVQADPERHKASKWMLLHISGLLSLSFLHGIDFLVKDCLFTIMILLNLFIIEGGDLNALGSLFCSKTNSSLFTSSNNIGRVPVIRNSSQLISSNFQKVQDTYFRTCSDKGRRRQHADTSEYALEMNDLKCNVSDSSCSGEIFLQCVLGNTSKVDVDDLANFIECKQGKDYSAWLKNRAVFRQWKYKKMNSLRWKKKKAAWSRLKGR